MTRTTDILRQLNIFEGVSEEHLGELLCSEGVCETQVKKGTVIIQSAKQLMILLKGTAVVTNGDAILRTFAKGSVFGVVTLFSDKGAETQITAKNDCTLLIIPEKAFENLLMTDGRASVNYIRFLTDRIHFLNSVIDRYTGGSVEDNLCAYLINIARQRGNTFALNMSATATRLNIGRASLYRALDSLCEKGAIIKDGRNITIADKNLLTVNGNRA